MSLILMLAFNSLSSMDATKLVYSPGAGAEAHGLVLRSAPPDLVWHLWTTKTVRQNVHKGMTVNQQSYYLDKK